MIIRRGSDQIPSSEITPEKLYLNRRKFIGAGFALAAGSVPMAAVLTGRGSEGPAQEELTPWDAVTTYNNYYEFGIDKDEPARLARNLRTSPWHVRVDGLCDRPGLFSLDDLLRGHTSTERVYRMRCVEGWSMVIPWNGFPLWDMLRRFEPQASARYVAFETLNDPEQMPGLDSPVLDWPYREGLRLDEAQNPLATLVTGVYGRPLPPQNGAPIRIVLPWKYGFKGIKSIVRISFVESQPPTSWNMANPGEYGFYANVNPEVDHPRWSQARERRIGELRPRPTLMFNGYTDQVASMYSGMDLRRYY
jgi:methionine sulfoxide reductase catalytic subunit